MPFFPDEQLIDTIEKDRPRDPKIAALNAQHLEFMRRIMAGGVLLSGGANASCGYRVYNLHLSECFSCEKVTVWLKQGILWPQTDKYEVAASEDMPDDVRADFDEARLVLAVSPRSAAALLRLCLQKLCVHLNLPGKNINDDIATLVKRGLDVRIQQALDVVRVVGNNAVHPGQMDLKDDRATAEKLFTLVNKIVHDLITHPKELEAIYKGLPPAALAAIAKRDSNP